MLFLVLREQSGMLDMRAANGAALSEVLYTKSALPASNQVSAWQENDLARHIVLHADAAGRLTRLLPWSWSPQVSVRNRARRGCAGLRDDLNRRSPLATIITEARVVNKAVPGGAAYWIFTGPKLITGSSASTTELA